MNSEEKFWEQVRVASKTGWVVHGPGAQGQIDAQGMTVRVYLVDASSGWIGAGVMAPQWFEAQARFAVALQAQPSRGPGLPDGRRQIERATEAAIGGCLMLAAAGPTLDDQALQQAVRAAVAALAVSGAYRDVMHGSGDVRGHWLFVVYRLGNQTTLSRAAYCGVDAGQAGLLSASDIVALVDDLVRYDVSGGSELSATIRAAGGLHLSRVWGDSAQHTGGGGIVRRAT